MFTFTYKRAELVAHFENRAEFHLKRAEDLQSKANNLREKGPDALHAAMTDMLAEGVDFENASYPANAYSTVPGYGGMQSAIGSQVAALVAQFGAKAGAHRDNAKKFTTFASHVPNEPSFSLTLEELRVFELVIDRDGRPGLYGLTG